MSEWWLVAATLLFIALLLASGVWANRHFARFNQIPAHFDISGNATRLAPRTTMVWLLPALFSVMQVAIMLSVVFIPAEYRNGDPAVAVLLSGVILLGAQAFVLWLTERWARAQ